MSRPERRRELAAIRDQEDRDREAENFRKASLPLFLQVDELHASDEMKAILLLIAERAGVDIYNNPKEDRP